MKSALVFEILNRLNSFPSLLFMQMLLLSFDTSIPIYSVVLYFIFSTFLFLFDG